MVKKIEENSNLIKNRVIDISLVVIVLLSVIAALFYITGDMSKTDPNRDKIVAVPENKSTDETVVRSKL